MFIPLDANSDYDQLAKEIEKIPGVQIGVDFMIDGTTRPSIGANQQLHFYLQGHIRNSDIPEE